MNDPDPSATYSKIVVGLSQGKGAVSVYSAVNQSVIDSASTVQALRMAQQRYQMVRHH